MVYKFAHYTAFDDTDGEHYGVEGAHIQVCCEVVFDTDHYAGTLKITGAVYDPQTGNVIMPIEDEYEIS